MAKEETYMDREWTCPYCGSQTVGDYKERKSPKGHVKTVDVTCGDCECHYLIFSDLDPEYDGSLLGQLSDEESYSEEDKRSAYDDQRYHEMRNGD